MSHFTVAVFTAEKPSDEQLTAILQPWHEYECTGIDDEYVVDVDVTDEMRADFEKYADEGQTFEDFVPDWSSAEVLEDGRCIRRTNPNKKWDWWTVGGRWTGLLTLKQGATGDLGHRAWCASAAEAGTADRARVSDVDLEAMANAGHPLRTFAVVKDGQWFQKGRMGWWACVSDAMSEDEWTSEFDKLLSASSDQFITIVDCHI
ncbi:hypothetical protein LH128_00090 [Sphingomonas sp. LH128]|uniref:hypothetical protein n=1 Tax=Sphingomonas sp. LH128 TaxID=473781 RepID=UPI00027CB13D|nr:hypothetical protein [Sphingomonas sp. LH128]EJU15135.1 hypothetical protein LH128_00090 [Sphingomonas sp. LH128]